MKTFYYWLPWEQGFSAAGAASVPDHFFFAAKIKCPGRRFVICHLYIFCIPFVYTVYIQKKFAAYHLCVSYGLGEEQRVIFTTDHVQMFCLCSEVQLFFQLFPVTDVDMPTSRLVSSSGCK